MGIIASQIVGYTWQQIAIGDAFILYGTTYYYHGTVASGNSSPKPRIAITNNGANYHENNFSSIWTSVGSAFPFLGGALPTTGIEIGGVFFLTNNTFWKRIA